jgi:hypothetical protein
MAQRRNTTRAKKPKQLSEEEIHKLTHGITIEQTPRAIPMDQIEPLEVEWVWRPFLPKAELTLVEGDSDQGKSLIGIDLLARITRGSRLPLGDGVEWGSVMIMSKEDDPHRVLRPRLEAARAQVHFVQFFGYQRFWTEGKREKKFKEEVEALTQFAGNLTHLEDEIKRLKNLRVLLIDPIADFSYPFNLNDEAQCRRFLDPIRRLARKYNFAIIGVRHINKRTDLSAIHRGGGSVGIRAVARSQWIVGQHPEEPDHQVMVLTKSNLSNAPKNSAIRFRLKPSRYNEDHPKVVWGDRLEIIDPDDVLKPKRERGKQGDVIKFLTDFLTDGPKPQVDVVAAVNNAGLCSKRTLDSVKKAVGIDSYKEGRVWYWRLPSSNIASAQTSQSCNVEEAEAKTPTRVRLRDDPSIKKPIERIRLKDPEPEKKTPLVRVRLNSPDPDDDVTLH